MTEIGGSNGKRLTLLGALLALAAAVSACGASDDDPLAAVRELHEEQRYAESLQPLRAILDENPDQPEVNLLLGSYRSSSWIRTNRAMSASFTPTTGPAPGRLAATGKATCRPM